MKVLFLGTGASDWPQHKKSEDEFFRRYSSVLIDECILIDPGPSVVDAIEEHGVDVTKNAAVGDSIKVKAGNTTGTIVRVVAVDTVYGATLYDETTTGGRFVPDKTTADAIIVGTDAATVVANGNEATATDGVVNIKADTGSNGKTASLRLEVTNGTKKRFIDTALDILS